MRREFIKYIPQISQRVGHETFCLFLYELAKHALNLEEDLIILEAIKTLQKLASLKLINKTQSLDILDKILPYLVHPNRALRQATISYISCLSPSSNQENNSE